MCLNQQTWLFQGRYWWLEIDEADHRFLGPIFICSVHFHRVSMVSGWRSGVDLSPIWSRPQSLIDSWSLTYMYSVYHVYYSVYSVYRLVLWCCPRCLVLTSADGSSGGPALSGGLLVWMMSGPVWLSVPRERERDGDGEKGKEEHAGRTRWGNILELGSYFSIDIFLVLCEKGWVVAVELIGGSAPLKLRLRIAPAVDYSGLFLCLFIGAVSVLNQFC